MKDDIQFGVIYGLYGPDGQLRYIGQTRQGIRRRLSGHLCAPRGPRSAHLPVARWVAALQATSREPLIKVIQGAIPLARLNEAEKDHIRLARARGEDLLNVSDGGQSSQTSWGMSEESIRRAAAAKIGRPRSLETRAKLSAANMGKKPTPETLKKRSVALAGKVQSSEWIEKRRLATAATKAAKPKADTCIRGHLWSDENTRWYKGRRNCRACARDDARRLRAERPPAPKRPRKPRQRLRDDLFAAWDRGAEITNDSVVAMTGQSQRAVYVMLSRAAQDGLIIRIRQGVYEMASEWAEGAA